VNLIVSDVLGDNLQAIASGPTVAPVQSAPAEEIVARYGLSVALPPAADPPCHPPAATRIVANLPTALAAAADAATGMGLRPVLLSDRLEGEAREVGRTLAAILAGSSLRHSPLRSGDCVLAGGETTVTVRGDGAGGRNTEAALVAAIELRGTAGVTVGFLATDGDDGVTGAAGAVVDGATIPPEQVARARRALANNASYDFLSASGATYAPGPTGTNVNDLVIAIIE
jgi:hydroxypyruvate reductase